MALTKDHIAHLIYTRLDLPKSTSSEVLESLLEIIKGTLAKGEDLQLRGFGKFSVKEKKQRMGRNPQTGDKILLRARRVARFKPSGILRDRINEKI